MVFYNDNKTYHGHPGIVLTMIASDRPAPKPTPQTAVITSCVGGVATVTTSRRQTVQQYQHQHAWMPGIDAITTQSTTLLNANKDAPLSVLQTSHPVFGHVEQRLRPCGTKHLLQLQGLVNMHLSLGQVAILLSW